MPLLAGVARAIVTPPLDIRLLGVLREGPPDRVHSELTVTSLALVSSSSSVVIVAIDAPMLSVVEADMIRAAIAGRVGIPATAVLVNVSHTHAAPSPPSHAEFDSELEPEVTAVHRAYHTLIVAQAVSTAATAYGRRVPARISASAGAVAIGVNRREVLPDGTLVLGASADGIVDPTVGVVRVDGADGSPLAVIFHYACHPDVLGPKSSVVSADYVGAARAAIEPVTGAMSVFLQGCCGDIDPVTGIVNGVDGEAQVGRLGRQLGGEVIRVYERINTTRAPAHRITWESAAAVITAWEYGDVVPRMSERIVDARSTRIRLPLRELPSVDLALKELERARRPLGSDASLPERLKRRKRIVFAELQLDAVQSGGPRDLDFEIAALRLGETVLVGLPFEPFVSIGLQIKNASPFAVTIVSGYSNGVYFYLPTCAAFDQGGYEIDSYRNYLQPAGPTSAWEAAVVAAAGALVEELWQAEPAPVGAS